MRFSQDGAHENGNSADMAQGGGSPSGLFRRGENVWRVARADKASVVIDAEAYFRSARKAMLDAQHQILLIGWDFDTRIELDSEEGCEGPCHLGPFLSWLAQRRPALNIHILKWDMGAIKLLGRGSTLFRLARWMIQDRISFRLDGCHPSGGAHHHKLVVIDDSIAFCGGIDMTGSRWDTRAHRHDDERRRRPTTRRQYGPWHDATMAVSGTLAAALGDYARERWTTACGETLPRPPRDESRWVEDLPVMFEQRDVAISRTRGKADGQDEVREIERLFVDMITAARKHVYVESQYFASRAIAQAIVDRLGAPHPPEIVIVNPKTADGWLEEAVMGSARAVLLDHVRANDPHGRVRIYTPVTDKGGDIYVHAKIMIVDDRILRVGSANFNNRSMGLDSECDLSLCADDPDTAEKIAALRADLLAEHLGTEVSEVERRLRETGSLIATIEALRSNGRSLKPFEPPEFSEALLEVARNQLLDPESADSHYEPARPGLLARIRRKARPGKRRSDTKP